MVLKILNLNITDSNNQSQPHRNIVYQNIKKDTQNKYCQVKLEDPDDMKQKVDKMCQTAHIHPCPAWQHADPKPQTTGEDGK